MSPSSSAVILAASLVLAAGGASAAAPSPAPANGSTPLDGLTVAVPRTPPAVVSTYPTAGATVAPGTLVLKVTFDQSMDPETWSYAKGAAGEYPQCLAKPRLLADNKTFVLLCSTGPNTSYSVRFNDGAETGFTSIGRRSATPFELKFSTASGGEVWTVKDALKGAGLRDEDSPIQGVEAATR